MSKIVRLTESDLIRLVKKLIQESNQRLPKKLFIEQDNLKVKVVATPDFYGGWEKLQEYLEKKGNPNYIIDGSLNLYHSRTIDTLGNLIQVNGDLILFNSYVTSLGRLTTVTGSMTLEKTEIRHLSHLKSVGGDLYISSDSPLLIKNSEEDIKNMVEIGGKLVIR